MYSYSVTLDKSTCSVTHSQSHKTAKNAIELLDWFLWLRNVWKWCGAVACKPQPTYWKALGINPGDTSCQGLPGFEMCFWCWSFWRHAVLQRLLASVRIFNNRIAWHSANLSTALYTPDYPCLSQVWCWIWLANTLAIHHRQQHRKWPVGRSTFLAGQHQRSKIILFSAPSGLEDPRDHVKREPKMNSVRCSKFALALSDASSWSWQKHCVVHKPSVRCTRHRCRSHPWINKSR